MALDLRTPTATNFHSFDPGDSILKSENLLAAFVECQALVLKAYKNYNQENPDVLLPEPEVSTDANTGINSCSIEMPYRKVGGVKQSLQYINDYSDWAEPTTGELTGLTSILDAFYYLAEAVDYGCSKLIPGIAINDVRGLTAIGDDNSKRTVTSTLPYNSIVSATGVEQMVAQDFFILLDLQENLPI